MRRVTISQAHHPAEWRHITSSHWIQLMQIYCARTDTSERAWSQTFQSLDSRTIPRPQLSCAPLWTGCCDSKSGWVHCCVGGQSVGTWQLGTCIQVCHLFNCPKTAESAKMWKVPPRNQMQTSYTFSYLPKTLTTYWYFLLQNQKSHINDHSYILPQNLHDPIIKMIVATHFVKLMQKSHKILKTCAKRLQLKPYYFTKC